MRDENFTVVGTLDSLGFPRGYHILLADDERTLCGVEGEERPGRLYESSEPVNCSTCLSLLDEALHIEEPVEIAAG